MFISSRALLPVLIGCCVVGAAACGDASSGTADLAGGPADSGLSDVGPDVAGPPDVGASTETSVDDMFSSEDTGSPDTFSDTSESPPDAEDVVDVSVADVELTDVAVVDVESELDTTSGVDTTIDPGNPIVAEPGTWTWIPIEGTVCGNGSESGVAVNLSDSSDNVLLVLQGGGICWDWNTCFVVKSAANIERTLTSAIVLQDLASTRSPFFDRTDATNPFRDASWVYVPYCTGDFFAGDSITSYAFLAERRNVHHRGARNWERVLPRLKDTFVAPETVWVAGFSAGGLGVTYNWWRFMDLWPASDVHALNDCGVPFDPVAGRFDEWKQAINFVFPPGCADCADGQQNIYPHYAATVDPRHRLGLLAYRNDLVLQLFTGLGPVAVAARTDALRAAMPANNNQRSYFINGTDHVMNQRLKTVRTSQASGAVFGWDWVRAWANGTVPWDHNGP